MVATESLREVTALMECRYCQTWNADDDHRCRRCGRRSRMMPVYTASAAAPALQYEPVAPAEPVPETAPPAAARRAVNYQPSLFSSKELPRVVPFESIAPEVVRAPRRKQTSPAARAHHRRIIPGQQSLEFSPARSVRPTDGMIYCDAPVAIPMHRAMAAALDASVVLMAVAVFVGIFSLAGGHVVFTTRTAPLFLGVVAAILFLYKFLWCMAAGDTPGMRWTRITLVDFDGKVPDVSQRLSRMASGWLSFLAAGMGLIWALVDDETLTWHDHISRTFPTPY